MFTKAVRKKRKLKIAMSGPSGSGKTKSALRLAAGLVSRSPQSTKPKIAVIDTENDSASMYAKEFEFDTCVVGAPYSPEKYWEAIKFAIKQGYEVLIIDSLSHEWAGTGGLLEQKEVLDSRPKSNNFANWGSITKKHNAFIAAIVDAPIHIIGTLRSKMEYAQLVDSEGKKSVKKVGAAPIQRDSFEYEWDILLDIQMNHECETSKDRTGIFNDKIFQITEETGDQLLEWLDGSVDAPIVKTESVIAPVKKIVTKAVENVINIQQGNKAIINAIYNHFKQLNLSNEDMRDVLYKLFKITTFANLTPAHFREYNSIISTGMTLFDEYVNRVAAENAFPEYETDNIPDLDTLEQDEPQINFDIPQVETVTTPENYIAGENIAVGPVVIEPDGKVYNSKDNPAQVQQEEVERQSTLTTAPVQEPILDKIPNADTPTKPRNMALGEVVIPATFPSLVNFGKIKLIPRKNVDMFLLKASEWPKSEELNWMINSLKGYWGL